MYFCPGWQNIFFLGYKKIFFDIYFLFFRLWCSTGVDEDGQHIVNGQNWAHCSDSCPVSDTEVTPVSSAFSIVSSIHQSLWWILWHNITQSLNIFQEKPQLCKTTAGVDGTCRLPSQCIGATIQFLEDNECSLDNGELGTCCVPVPVDNIINIIDGPQVENYLQP